MPYVLVFFKYSNKAFGRDHENGNDVNVCCSSVCFCVKMSDSDFVCMCVCAHVYHWCKSAQISIQRGGGGGGLAVILQIQ